MSRFASRSARSLVSLAIAAGLAIAPAGAATMRAFVTSTACSGDLWACSAAGGDTGVVAANNVCQEAAAAVGLDAGGALFRAWLSDATTDAYCNVLGLAGKRSALPACGVGSLPAAGPWMRVDGLPYVESLPGLTSDGGTLTTIPVDESGAYVANTFFATGSDGNGTVNPTLYCNNWTDGTLSFSTNGGNTDSLGSGWGTGATIACLPGLRLLCFETGAGDPLAYPSVPGALVFVTSTRGSGDLASWDGSGGVGGLAGGDAICQALAAAAFLPLPDSFVALLSDGATDAATRLTLDGPWKRVDGVLLADSLADLTDGALDDAIAYDELGARFFTDAWTGTTEAGLSTANHCLGWTSGVAGDTGTRGRPWRSENDWTGVTPVGCQTSLHLFCFSNQLLLGWDNFELGIFRRWSQVVGQP